MPAASPPTLPERFHRLFRSHPNVYGRTEVAEGYDENGKRNSRSWLQKTALTPETWSHHLSGRQPIGCVPILPNNAVTWGAIDVDVYNGQFDFQSLHAKITAHSLPFVVCRSKSGGGHIYIFLKGETLAKHMVAKLEAFAAFFGQGSSEIFPKQVKLGTDQNDTDFGNWLNMPYDGPESLRYAQDDGGVKLSMSQFLDYAEARALTPAQFTDLGIPDGSNEILPEGPPCLNYIFTERAQDNEMRNMSLANAAVYLKKAYGDNWKDHLNRINNLFGEPLGDSELEGIKKSYDKHDYRYQCSKQPLCNYCNSRLCKQRKFGIGSDEIIPTNRSLTKLDTNPPLWYLTIEDKRIALTTDQLFNFAQFNKRCLEVLNKVFQPYAQKEWLANLASIAQNCDVIEVPEDMTEIGTFGELLTEFLCDTGSTEGPEVLLRRIPWETTECYYFRMMDLNNYLKRSLFTSLAPNEITSLLKMKFKAERHVQRVQRTTVSCWSVPRHLFHKVEALEPTLPEHSDVL